MKISDYLDLLLLLIIIVIGIIGIVYFQGCNVGWWECPVTNVTGLIVVR